MALVAGSLNAQNKCKLSIVVDGVEKVKGSLIVGVYDSSTYMKAAPVAWKIVKVTAETLTVEIDSIPAGEYAVSLFHDENDNGKLDRGAYGIPTEKYGSSNNAEGKMGPPTFKECKFIVEDKTVIYITLTKFEMRK